MGGRAAVTGWRAARAPGGLRRLALASGTALLVAAGVLAAPAAQACACGGVVDRPGFDMTVNGETAVVAWDGSTETVAIRLAAKGDAVDAGLLIPTPAPAKAELGDAQMFDDLATVSEPRVEEEFHLFGPAALFGDGSDSSSGGAPSAPGSVQVLEQVTLGPLEATTLAADDPAALDDWLSEHDYEMSPDFAALVTPYTDEGWAFVAVRLSGEGTALAGELPPISLSFASDEIVYPMRMSQGAKEQQVTRTYVLGEHRVERTDPTASEGSSAQVAFAGTVPAAQVTSPALRALVAEQPYLTTIDQTFGMPSEQVRSDFTFGQAADDTAYQVVVTKDTYGIPIDVAILIALVAGGIGFAVVTVLRRRRQPQTA